MGEDHHQTRGDNHGFSHVLIFRRHDHYSLLSWNSFSYILLISTSIELSRLERTESCRPPPFVSIHHQLRDQVRGAAAITQSSLDDVLESRIWCRYHPSPSPHPGRLESGQPPHCLNGFLCLIRVAQTTAVGRSTHTTIIHLLRVP